MPPKPYHHGDLKNVLLKAGRQALSTTNPDEISLRQLSREAGVSANAPYRHFADRSELLHALMLDGFESLTTAVRDRAADASPEARLRGFADCYLEFAKAEPGLFRLMFGPPKPGERLPARFEALEGFFAELVATLDGIASPDDPELSLRRAVAIWTAVHGSTVFAMDGTLAWLDTWMRPTNSALAVAMHQGFRQPDHDGDL